MLTPDELKEVMIRTRLRLCLGPDRFRTNSDTRQLLGYLLDASEWSQFPLAQLFITPDGAVNGAVYDRSGNLRIGALGVQTDLDRMIETVIARAELGPVEATYLRSLPGVSRF